MTSGEFKPDNLIAGDFPRVTGWIAPPASATSVIKRGTIMSVTGAGGTSVAGTGSTTIYGVLAEDFTPGQAQMTVYLTGEFAAGALILANNDPLAQADITSLRAKSIFVKNTIPAV